MTGRALRAQISVRCCGTTAPERTAGPCWQLFVMVPGRAGDWPVFTWPTSLQAPTLEERSAALAALGYTLADGAGWEWCEDTTPEYHPHPARVALMAAARVRPADGDCGVTGAARCPAAHPDDPTPCDGPAVVTVLDSGNAGAEGCEHHGARMLASLERGRVYPLPDAPAGAAIRVFTAADGIPPFVWYEGAPRTQPNQRSHAENRRRGVTS